MINNNYVLKTLWYSLFKFLVKFSLFFYTKKIIVNGKENIPKKGAVLFLVNHPNGLIDPLIVAVNNPRTQYFLVRAASFKNPLIKRFLESLNLMPIFRMRDGVRQLGNNLEVFSKCFDLLKQQKALMIFQKTLLLQRDSPEKLLALRRCLLLINFLKT